MNDISLVGEGFCNNKINIAVCNISDCFAGSSNNGNKDDEVNDACSSKSKL